VGVPHKQLIDPEQPELRAVPPCGGWLPPSSSPHAVPENANARNPTAHAHVLIDANRFSWFTIASGSTA